VIVVDVLLVCNLVLFAVCAFRVPRQGRSRLDDLVAQARLDPQPASTWQMGQILAFPTSDELARRRARSAHPAGHFSHPSAQPLHPSQSARLPGRLTHPAGRFSHPSGGL
jgi:hypothetical protein